MVSWQQRSNDLQQDMLIIEDTIFPLMLWIIENNIALPLNNKKIYIKKKLKQRFENLKIVKY